MRTYLDCIPCFYKQALEAARIAGAEEKIQKQVLDELTKKVVNFPLSSPPPVMGKIIYDLVRKITQQKDPYKEIKRKSNELALRIYDKLKRKVTRASDRLLMAVELAIAGNIIDYGVGTIQMFSQRKGYFSRKGNFLDIEKELRRILDEEKKTLKKESERIFNYSRFKYAVKKAKTVLYLGDNAGEVVFDRILIEEIKRMYPDKRIIYAVRGGPIINDALIEDAYQCGIEKTAKVISCGANTPGVVLSLCSSEFLDIFEGADMVISKGQGNFEALSQQHRPIFFLFMAKCAVVAADVSEMCGLNNQSGCKVGDIVLFHYSGFN